MTIVLLDLDGTLLRHPSSEARFIGYLRRHRRLGAVQTAAAVWFMARWSARFGRHVARANKAYLYRLRVNEINELARQFVDEVLLLHLRRAVLAQMHLHRVAGHRLALLTGAPEFIAAPLAQRLGMDAWCATICARRRDRFSARPPLRQPLGPSKVEHGGALCLELGGHLHDCIAYADSIHDLPLLRAVRTPIAVHPDRRLTAVARRAGWTILTDGDESAMTRPAWQYPLGGHAD
ncbi:MAG: HAD-IB family phosphatase [Gammaproteobacteria bacterium]